MPGNERKTVEMSCQITVIGRVGEGDQWLVPLVRSLDAQTLPYDAFEVVFVTPGPRHRLEPRLRMLADRRPNVRVVEATAAEDVTELAVGDWVLDLGTDLSATRPVLFPQALQRLVDFGESIDGSAVLGGTVMPKTDAINDLYTANRIEVTTEDGGPVSGLTMRHRTRAGEPGRAALFADYPVAQVAGPLPAEATTGTVVTQADYRWTDGRLVAEVSGTVTGAPADAYLRFSVRQPSTGLEYWLPWDAAVTGEKFSARAEVDVATAALGHPLGTGTWQVRIGAHGAAPRWSSRAPLPAGRLSRAAIDGLLVTVGAGQGALLLDVGATTFSPVGRVSPSAVGIHESHRGTLMTMALDLASTGRTRQRGIVRLGNFNLPGYLLSDGDGSRVECYLSGLPGDLTMSTRFGTARLAPTGLTVSVSPIGHFSFSTRPPARRAPTSRAQRLRRRVPRPLEPLARSLAANPTARRLYRKLAGLNASGRTAR
jgi:hypothetical protein